MRTSAPAIEQPVFFDAGEETLFGIVSRPVGRANGAAVVMLTGGGFIPSFHRNRFFVRLSRAVAERGCASVRFDYHGVGESTGLVEVFRLDRPFIADALAAVGVARDAGADRVILIGTCFGARTALAAAAHVPDLAGLVLLSPPVRDLASGEKTATHIAVTTTTGESIRRALRPAVARGLFDPVRRRAYLRIARARARAVAARMRGRDAEAFPISPRFLEPLEEAVRRRTPVLLVYGSDDASGAQFAEATRGRLGRILSKGTGLVEVATVEGHVDGIPTVDGQERTLSLVADWIDRRASTEG